MSLDALVTASFSRAIRESARTTPGAKLSIFLMAGLTLVAQVSY